MFGSAGMRLHLHYYETRSAAQHSVLWETARGGGSSD